MTHFSKHTQMEQKTWRFLFAHQFELLKKRACPEYLEGLDKLKLNSRLAPSFEQLAARLKRVSGWTLVPVSRELEPHRYFSMILKNHFPLNPRMRPPNEFSFPSTPDFFHGAFGHAPLLTDSGYSSALRQLARLGEPFAPKAAFLSKMRAIHWYSFETGIFFRRKKISVYGAELLSSPMQLTSALGKKCDKRPLQPSRVLRRKLSFGLQSACFHIRDFSDLEEIILNWAHDQRGAL